MSEISKILKFLTTEISLITVRIIIYNYSAIKITNTHFSTVEHLGDIAIFMAQSVRNMK